MGDWKTHKKIGSHLCNIAEGMSRDITQPQCDTVFFLFFYLFHKTFLFYFKIRKPQVTLWLGNVM